MSYGRELAATLKRKWWQKTALTGAMAPSSVSSNTFSMADLEGSMGGGLTRVAWSAIAGRKESVFI